ncbi:hypothetical protein BLA29_005579 [Euroglyphus maynei]|uniref:Uncharacterized protein n=1 Tax=Euroglyphus maynei TaxID=6958 RepID=A0A1Y3AVL7_EURMA|nr:hypothetical protein BLA29_005579 [Euroglyphus maynei]
MLKLIPISIVLLAINGCCIAVLPELDARHHCRSLYQRYPDDLGTFFTNNHCKVQCNYTNQIRQCLPRQVPPHQQGPSTSPIVFPIPNRQNGHLTILSTKAELSIPERNTYLMICVLNNVAEPIHHLPLEDNYWNNRCYSCSSDIVQETRTPIYNSPCPMSERHVINQNSRIIFEIWTHDSTPLPNGKPGRFVGGAHLRLKELIDRHRLGHPYSMHLSDGTVTGTLTTEIEWS